MRVFKAEILEDDPFAPAARITKTDGTYITQATTSSITYYVYDVDSATQTGTASLVVADTVYDTLQTSGWYVDSTGYNFLGTIPASCFATGNKVFRVEIVFTPTTGSSIVIAYDVTTVERYSS